MEKNKLLQEISSKSSEVCNCAKELAEGWCIYQQLTNSIGSVVTNVVCNDTEPLQDAIHFVKGLIASTPDNESAKIMGTLLCSLVDLREAYVSLAVFLEAEEAERAEAKRVEEAERAKAKAEAEAKRVEEAEQASRIQSERMNVLDRIVDLMYEGLFGSSFCDTEGDTRDCKAEGQEAQQVSRQGSFQNKVFLHRSGVVVKVIFDDGYSVLHLKDVRTNAVVVVNRNRFVSDLAASVYKEV